MGGVVITNYTKFSPPITNYVKFSVLITNYVKLWCFPADFNTLRKIQGCPYGGGDNLTSPPTTLYAKFGKARNALH